MSPPPVAVRDEYVLLRLSEEDKFMARIVSAEAIKRSKQIILICENARWTSLGVPAGLSRSR